MNQPASAHPVIEPLHAGDYAAPRSDTSKVPKQAVHRPVTGPTACHAVLPLSAAEGSGMGATAAFYKPDTYSCTSINSRAQTK